MLYAFDMGNVAIKGIEFLEKTISLLGVCAPEFLLDYAHYNHVLMEGLLSDEDYYRHVEHAFGIKVPGRPLSDFFNPRFNQPVVKVISALRSDGHRIICASNTFEPHWSIIQKRGLDVLFDKCYLSHEMGVTKPSAAFFRHIMKSENVQPEEMMFIDDMKENIDAAKQLGIKTLWYHAGYDDSTLMMNLRKAL